MAPDQQAGFAAVASRFLALSTTTTSQAPLFHSAADFELPFNNEDDILGEEVEEEPFRRSPTSTRGRLALPREHDDSLLSDDDAPPPSRTSVASRLWERSALPAFAKGWKTHESTSAAPAGRRTLPPRQLAPEDIYSEFASERHSSSSEDNDNEEDSSPPSFLSPLPGSMPGGPIREPPTEPLLHNRTLWLYPSARRQGGGVTKGGHRDHAWIVAYGICALGAFITFIRILWLGWDSQSSSATLLPSLPTLSLLSLASLVAGLLSLFYLLTLPTAIRHSVTLTLIGAPVILVAIGVIAFAGSFGNQGAEGDAGWKKGVRIFALICWVGAGILARVGLRRRKSVERTVKVLELATSILTSHPPLLLLCLALSLFSTVLSIPFLFILASLISDPFHHSHGLLFTWGSLAVLGTYIWTLEILRGMQRVTVAGVVGAWYFERHEEEHPGPVEVTRASFSRASGPSLGTIIASSFLLSLFATLSSTLSRLRTFLRSPSVPALLQPLTYLVPLLSFLASVLDIFTGYVLVYAGLSGDAFLPSARKVARLMRTHNTHLIADNLLVKTLLFVTSLVWALLAGLIAFLIASSRITDPRLSPLLGVLCVVVPGWVMRLCGGMVVDAADTLFMAFNLDLDRNTEHCVKATEAFGEPDTESLA